jgi:hypothetical protein
LFLKNQSQKNFVVVRAALFLRKETTTKKNEPPHVLVKSKVQGICNMQPRRMALLLRLIIDLRPIVAIEHSHSPNTVDQE